MNREEYPSQHLPGSAVPGVEEDQQVGSHLRSIRRPVAGTHRMGPVRQGSFLSSQALCICPLEDTSDLQDFFPHLLYITEAMLHSSS